MFLKSIIPTICIGLNGCLCFCKLILHKIHSWINFQQCIFQIISDLFKLNWVHKSLRRYKYTSVCYMYWYLFHWSHHGWNDGDQIYLCSISTDLYVPLIVYTPWIMLRSVIERITFAITNIFLINEKYIYHR